MNNQLCLPIIGLVAFAAMMVLAVLLGTIELGVLDFGVKKWAIIVLASLGVSGGLMANASKDASRAKSICSVLAFTGTGTALIISV